MVATWPPLHKELKPALICGAQVAFLDSECLPSVATAVSLTAKPPTRAELAVGWGQAFQDAPERHNVRPKEPLKCRPQRRALCCVMAL